MQKAFVFYIGNDVNKKVSVTLTEKELSTFYKVYGFETDEQIYKKLLTDMEDSLAESVYESFVALKEDYENYIHEIVDVGAAGRSFRMLMNGLAFVDKERK